MAAKSASKAGLKRVTFVTRVGEAKEVMLAGDFTAWTTDKIRLTPGAGGEWKADFKLPPGQYQYRLVVNGEWRDHAEAAHRVPNPYGTQNCVLTIS